MPPQRTDSNRFPLLWAIPLMVAVLAGGLWVLVAGDEEPGGQPDSPALVGTRPETRRDPATVDVAPAPDDGRGTRMAVPTPEVVPPLEAEVMAAQPGQPVGGIQGRVLTGDGRPVTDAQITLHLGNPMISGSFPGLRRRVDVQDVTNNSGAFRLTGVPVGKAYVVVAEHEAYARTELNGVRVRKDKVTKGAVLYMDDGAVIEGTVKVVDGPPIAEARVELYNTVELAFRPPEEQRPWKVVFTDTAGHFLFQHVSGSSFRVRVDAPGYETVSRVISFALEARARDQTLDFELNPGVTLGGIVVDAAGLPVDKVRIEAHSLTKRFQSTSLAISDAGGQFLLEGLGDHHYQIRAQAHGYTDYTRPKVHPNEGRIQVVLYQRGSVDGWVTDLSGKPIRSFELHLMRSQPRGTANYLNDHRSFRDPEGRFQFDNLDPGAYVLEARADGHADARSDPFTLTRDSAELAPLQILMGSGGTLSGVVRFANGEMAPGSVVKVNINNHIDSAVSRLFSQLGPNFERERQDRTDAQGQFKIDLIPPGDYQVEARHADTASFIQNDVKVVDDQTGANRPFHIQLPAGAIIAGRAVDGATSPLPFTKVQISMQGTGFMDADTTDKDGTWRFANLREGTYTLSLTPARLKNVAVNPFKQLVYAQRSQQEIYVSEGQVREGVVLVLRMN